MAQVRDRVQEQFGTMGIALTARKIDNRYLVAKARLDEWMNARAAEG